LWRPENIDFKPGQNYYTTQTMATPIFPTIHVHSLYKRVFPRKSGGALVVFNQWNRLILARKGRNGSHLHHGLSGIYLPPER
jgi:hypothetical protein